ncbi:hypothetical protein ACVNIS_01685 [Sphaerotilaceae bacterium SBD11-9]
MRKLFRRLAAPGLLALAVLGGCAAPRAPIPNYTPPASGPVAKLALRGYGADLYGIFYFADSQTCTDSSFVGSGRRNGEPPKSVNLVAGQWATLDFVAWDDVRNTTCRVRWSFQPTADRTYVLSGTANPTSCVARIYDATNPDDMKLESTAIARKVDGKLCLSIEEAQERKRKFAAANPGAGTRDEPMLAPSATADDLKGLIGK